MGNLLLIESGTNVCSIALAKDGKVIGIKESTDEKAHASQLTSFIDQLVKETGLNVSLLDAVVVSKGPGSYTGLRIGVSAAKGICYAADKPLISIGSLDSLAQGAISIYQSLIIDNSIEFVCPMIDARRMEVYTAIYDTSLNKIKDTEAVVVNEQTFSGELKKGKIIFLGNGAAKCRNVINSPNAFFVENFTPSAQFMIPLANNAYENKIFENIAYFEPFYLKDFVATISKKNPIPGLQ